MMLYGNTWVEAAFHVFPYSVLDGTDKLARANLCVHLRWENKADLRSVRTQREGLNGRRSICKTVSQMLNVHAHRINELRGNVKIQIIY